MTPQSPTPSAEDRKSPADFDREAVAFNTRLDELTVLKADAQRSIDAHMTKRDALIAGAKDYGLTGSYARTLLRKA
jgi:hypothetical protein